MTDIKTGRELAPQIPESDIFLRRATAVLEEVAPTDGTRRTAVVPGRLDVMGGIAEYSGAVVVGCTLEGRVSVAVRTREDGRYVVLGIPAGAEGFVEPVEFGVAEIANAVASGAITGADFRAGDIASPWLEPVIGVFHELERSRKRNEGCRGATLVVDGDLVPHCDLAYPTAVAVAALSALCAAWGLRLDADECAALATRAQHAGGGVPCGPSAALCVREGRPGAMLPIDCQAIRMLSLLTLPGAFAIVGIDSGVKHRDAEVKYRRARTAASMGARVIQLARTDHNGHPDGRSGPLAQLTIDDYVNHLRDRIPIRIRGVDFCTRYHGTSDPLAEIEPDFVYKVRSRTEHHIYEAVRARQFVERISFAERTGNANAMVEAGELMYASHWSYGQRCGLGSVETDRMVSLLRHAGPERGIYGARISAHGAGGIVVALIDSSPRGRADLAEVLSEYQRATSRTTQVFETTTADGPVFTLH